MPALDFKEISPATSGAGRDQFELLAREFLELCGLHIVEGPDRGADGGRDLIAEEIRTGIVGESRVRWLVSCKHKAHSGASVTPSDELDVVDRLNTHNCQGFMGFYSTVQSTGLAGKLKGVSKSNEVEIYDPEKIEKRLLSPDGLGLAKRFFPISAKKWQEDHPAPARVFSDDPELHCEYCQKNLLQPGPEGIVVLWASRAADDDEDRTEHLYWCCRGACDEVLRRKYYKDGLVDGWESLNDLVIPIVYVRWVISLLNEINSGAVYSEQAFERSKELLLCLYPLVCRHPTVAEEDRVKDLLQLPGYLGGLG